MSKISVYDKALMENLSTGTCNLKLKPVKSCCGGGRGVTKYELVVIDKPLLDPHGVQRLIKQGANPNAIVHRKTMLYYAIMYSALTCIRVLVDNNADVNGRCVNEYTPLMGAVAHKKQDVAEFLIQEGADVNLKLRDGRSAMTFAIHNYKYTGKRCYVDLIKDSKNYVMQPNDKSALLKLDLI